MASMSITISDGLAAKIVDHWGSNAEWKDAVKAWTKEQVREARIREARETANADLRDAIEAIEADDAAEVG